MDPAPLDEILLFSDLTAEERAEVAASLREVTVDATSPMQLRAMFLRDFKQIQRRMPALTESLRARMAENAARTGF